MNQAQNVLKLAKICAVEHYFSDVNDPALEAFDAYATFTESTMFANGRSDEQYDSVAEDAPEDDTLPRSVWEPFEYYSVEDLWETVSAMVNNIIRSAVDCEIITEAESKTILL